MTYFLMSQVYQDIKDVIKESGIIYAFRIIRLSDNGRKAEGYVQCNDYRSGQLLMRLADIPQISSAEFGTRGKNGPFGHRVDGDYVAIFIDLDRMEEEVVDVGANRPKMSVSPRNDFASSSLNQKNSQIMRSYPFKSIVIFEGYVLAEDENAVKRKMNSLMRMVEHDTSTIKASDLRGGMFTDTSSFYRLGDSVEVPPPPASELPETA